MGTELLQKCSEACGRPGAIGPKPDPFLSEMYPENKESWREYFWCEQCYQEALEALEEV